MSAEPLDAYVALAQKLAETSGPIARRYFRSGLEVEDKSDDTPVTRADREIESAMRALIEAAYPDHGIIGEEYGTVRGEAEFVWVIDPIDGTRSFIAGLPIFGTLIALAHNSRPIVGVIDHPALGERWVGAKGRATTLNGNAVTTRPCSGLRDATLYCTAPEMFDSTVADQFNQVRDRTRVIRYSTDCYGYAMVASGFGDLVIEAGMSTYDYMALVPVIEGAGGVITDWQGKDLAIQSDGRVVASGDRGPHDQVLELLRRTAASVNQR
ncbi:MAG: histidinol-phosphatase [Alphaproteobacteria bacterium]